MIANENKIHLISAIAPYEEVSTPIVLDQKILYLIYIGNNRAVLFFD